MGVGFRITALGYKGKDLGCRMYDFGLGAPCNWKACLSVSRSKTSWPFSRSMTLLVLPQNRLELELDRAYVGL